MDKECQRGSTEGTAVATQTELQAVGVCKMIYRDKIQMDDWNTLCCKGAGEFTQRIAIWIDRAGEGG
jgi:hypothetical protein